MERKPHSKLKIIISSFSNSAPGFFKDMLDMERIDPTVDINQLWRDSRDSRDWRLYMRYKRGCKLFSGSLTVQPQDISRAIRNNDFNDLIKRGKIATGKPPLDWGE